MENEKMAWIAVYTADDQAFMLRQPMSDAQMSDYRAHPDAYFGKIKYVPKGLKGPYDLFKFFMHAFAQLPREKLLEHLHLTQEAASTLSDEELKIEYSERMVAASGMFESVDGVLQAKTTQSKLD